MFDIGASELLVIVIVAVLVIGPKDLPLALRTAGRWVGKIRRVSGHFRAGIDTMIREAEMEDMEKKWREQNRRIMDSHPPHPREEEPAEPDSPAEMQPLSASEAKSESASAEARAAGGNEPRLPLDRTSRDSD